MNSIHIKFAIPTVVTILLFSVATYFIIIKPFEARIKDDKRELLRSLTDTAWSILDDYHQEEIAGILTRAEAQEKAIERIRLLRYGNEHKDYFWVTDLSPKMIVHPWRPELNGTDLSDFRDPTGKQLFVDFVKAVESSGDAFVEYQWQWKDDPSRIEPKISYVKAFKPWGWIVGTGIYINDLQAEVATMKRQVLAMTGIITLVVAILLAYFVRKGIASERERQAAERELVSSRDTYQSLVEATTEGLMMIMAGECVYTNKIFSEMTGYSSDELGSEWGARLLSGEELARVVDNDADQNVLELKLNTKSGDTIDVIMAPSLLEFKNQRSRIYAFKDVTRDRQFARAAFQDREATQRDQIIAELQAAQLFLNQPVSTLTAPLVHVRDTDSMRDVARAMTEKGATAAIVQTCENPMAGIITDYDLRLSCTGDESVETMKAVSVMTSPVLTIDERTMIFEAALKMDEDGVQHFVVLGRDKQPTGIISGRELVQLHAYSSVNMVKSINAADSVGTIIKANARLPLLIQTLIRSGVGAEQITRIITTVTDSIARRLIGLAMDRLGEPPVPFAFVALGSEGRREQTLATDQDNVIIYRDDEADDHVLANAYFAKLGTMVCDWLDEVGYRYCPGEIMAKTPKYCQPLSQWKQYFSKWINTAGPQELLDVHIFFDFRILYGDQEIETQLRQHIRDQLTVSQSFMLYFAENCLLYKPPVTMFGKIAVKSQGEHAKTFDIKDAMKPIVNFARIYAIREGIDETNTIERLRRLMEMRVLKKESLDELVHCYSSMMKLRFEQQAKELADGREPGNHINPHTLTDIEKAVLKEAFSQITTFQNKISFDFRGRPL